MPLDFNGFHNTVALPTLVGCNIPVKFYIVLPSTLHCPTMHLPLPYFYQAFLNWKRPQSNHDCRATQLDIGSALVGFCKIRQDLRRDRFDLRTSQGWKMHFYLGNAGGAIRHWIQRSLTFELLTCALRVTQPCTSHCPTMQCALLAVIFYLARFAISDS
jgi:hypothetical protein